MNTAVDVQWYDIPGFGGRYKISKAGDIYSSYIKRNLKPYVSEGYLCVKLYGLIEMSQKSVHRLLAEVFIDNPNNLPMVNHKDGDRLNNTLSNLEWCTAQYNSEHGFAKTFNFICPEGIPITIRNLKRFCANNNLNNGAMHQLRSGRIYQHKGWTFDS